MKRTLIIITVLTSFLLTSLYLYASPSPNTLNELEQEKDKMNQEIQKLKNSQIDLNGKKVLKESEKKEFYNEISNLENEISSIDEKLARAESDYKEKVEIFSKRFSVMYQSLDKSNQIFQMLIDSRSLEDFLDKYHIVTFITKKDKDMLDCFKMAKAEFESNKEIREGYIKLNKNKIKTSQKDINTIEKDANKLKLTENDINDKVAFMNKLESDMLAQSINITYVLSKVTGGKYVGGNLKWPISGIGSISSPYGYRTHPITGVYKFHSGIDIPAPYGTNICAANAGKVIQTGFQTGYGNTIVVDHGGGITTLYAHCSSILASVGQGVEAGKPICKVGSTGSSTGNHLHFEVRNFGVTKNPLEYVNKP